ncbi:hypothetical protein D3C81_2178610 [compost metagenome]
MFLQHYHNQEKKKRGFSLYPGNHLLTSWGVLAFHRMDIVDGFEGGQLVRPVVEVSLLDGGGGQMLVDVQAHLL